MRYILAITLSVVIFYTHAQSVLGYKKKNDFSIYKSEIKSFDDLSIQTADGNLPWRSLIMLRPYFKPTDSFIDIARSYDFISIDTTYVDTDPGIYLPIGASAEQKRSPGIQVEHLRSKLGLSAVGGILLAAGALVSLSEVDVEGLTAEQAQERLDQRRVTSQLLYGAGGAAFTISLFIKF